MIDPRDYWITLIFAAISLDVVTGLGDSALKRLVKFIRRGTTQPKGPGGDAC